MIALGISTSTERGSVALVDGDRVLAHEAWVHLEGHAERLFGALDAIFERAGVDRRALARVGCDVGPGSFTGVRVGVASAQGLALGLGASVVPVLSLEAMAWATRAGDGDASAPPSCAVALDAKKSEAYLAEYADGRLVAEPLHLPRVEAIAWLEAARARGLPLVGGFAAELLAAEGFAAELLADVQRAERCDLPHAITVAQLAARREPSPLGAAALAPEYVRAPDAKPQPGFMPAASAQSST